MKSVCNFLSIKKLSKSWLKNIEFKNSECIENPQAYCRLQILNKFIGVILRANFLEMLISRRMLSKLPVW